MNEAQIESNGYALREGFDAIEALEQASVSAGFEICYRQLQPGVLRANSILRELNVSQASFMHDAFNRSIEIYGKSPDEFITIVIPKFPEQFKLNSKILSPGDIIIGDSASEFLVVSQYRQDIFSAHLPKSLFLKLQHVHIPQLRDSTLSSLNVLNVGKRGAKDLIQLINSIIHAKSSSYENDELLDKYYCILFRLIKIATNQANELINFRQKYQKVKSAINYIQEHASGAIKISDICKFINVSERTLDRMFRSEFNMTPYEYITNHRLNVVRRKLNNAICNNFKISDIAHNSGFTHMGRFSGSYTKQFCIKPRDEKRL